MHTALLRLSQTTSHLRQTLARNSMSTKVEQTRATGPKELQTPGLVFLTAQTPNGNKVLYLAEELKAAGKLDSYTVIPISFAKNEQKENWFESVNPNGRIPALLHNREDKAPLAVWESASINLYLARVYDKEGLFWFPNDEDLQTELLNWTMFLQGGVGPMQGQANHFFRYAPEKIPYGINRYQNETKRLYQVYEDHLSGAKDGIEKTFLVGQKYTIADQVTQPWVRVGGWAGVDVAPFPHLAKWVERIEQRPATIAALKIPEQDMLTKQKNDPSFSADAHAKEASKWVMKGNETK